MNCLLMGYFASQSLTFGLALYLGAAWMLSLTQHRIVTRQPLSNSSNGLEIHEISMQFQLYCIGCACNHGS